MSDCFNHEADAWDDLLFGRSDDDEGYYLPEQQQEGTVPRVFNYTYYHYTTKKNKVTCKFCGKRKLHWTHISEGWRLFTKKGKLHKCKAYGKTH